MANLQASLRGSEVKHAPNWRHLIRRPSTIIVAVLLVLLIGGAYYVGQHRTPNPNITPLDLLVAEASSQVKSVSGVSDVTDEYLGVTDNIGSFTVDLDPTLSAEAQLLTVTGISKALADKSISGKTIYAEVRIGNAMIGVSPNAAGSASRLRIANALSAVPDVSQVRIPADEFSVTVNRTTSSDPILLLDEVFPAVSAIAPNALITANTGASTDMNWPSLYGNGPLGVVLVDQGLKSVTYPAAVAVTPAFRAQAELLGSSPSVRGYQLEVDSGNTLLDVAVPTRAAEPAVRSLVETGATALPASSIRFEYVDSQ